MSIETTNLGLVLYDTSQDKDEKVRDVINNVLGYTNSNMTKIDSKTKTIDDNISTLHDYVVGEDGNVVFYNKQEVFLAVHPVGSIFLSTDGTEPAELYGGTWEQIKDVFLLGAGDNYPAGSTGGEESVKLTRENIPILPTRQGVAAVNTVGSAIHIPQWGWIYTATQVTNSDGYNSYTAQWADVGTEDEDMQNVNNMPPYYSVYIWRRVA